MAELSSNDHHRIRHRMTRELEEFVVSRVTGQATGQRCMCVDRSKTLGQGRSQWPHGLRRGSTAARLLGLWVRIPPRAWMSVVSVVCCRADPSSRGVLSSVVCLKCVIVKPR
jgi:hypothetical protein